MNSSSFIYEDLAIIFRLMASGFAYIFHWLPAADKRSGTRLFDFDFIPANIAPVHLTDRCHNPFLLLIPGRILSAGKFVFREFIKHLLACAA